MLYRRLVVVAAFSCIAIPALAETPAPAASTPASSDAGMTMAESATVKLKLVTVEPADVLSSKLIGTTVYNNKKESVGEIEDLVIKNGKTLGGVVISVGGFLGLGERYVVVDPSAIALTMKDGKWSAYVDTDKDTLNKAPAFDYSKKK